MSTYTGINIQYPISQLILDGTKEVETRTYPLPDRLVGVTLLLIETPGKTGKFRSRIAGTISFGPSVQYKSANAFYKDIDRHRVTENSPWAWTDEKPKWAWPILSVKRLTKPKTLNKRPGIVYTAKIRVSDLSKLL